MAKAVGEAECPTSVRMVQCGLGEIKVREGDEGRREWERQGGREGSAQCGLGEIKVRAWE